MDDEADILDVYYKVIDQDPKCRNIKNAERRAFQSKNEEDTTQGYYMKLSLSSVPSTIQFKTYLERNLDITFEEFLKILKFETKLHGFALKHSHTDIDIIKQCLYKRKYNLLTTFKELIPSNFVTLWIYWNKCKFISYSLDTILLMQYDTFIVIYDMETLRRCIYRTTVNSDADPTLLVGSKQAPMFAYTECGIYYPKIFVISYHELKTISILCDKVKGKYINLKFSLRQVLVSLKAGYKNAGLRFVVWNWTKGEKIVVYDQESSNSILADCVIFNWEESLGIGAILKRSTTYNDQCELVNVINATVFRQNLYEKLTVIFKLEERYYQSFMPKDLCIIDDTVYIADETGDLYALEGVVSIVLVLKKKWALLHKRPKCPVRVVRYRDGLLIYGPEGVLKRYYKDGHKEWHCSWWMDLYDIELQNIVVFGRPEYLYAICPFNGILKLNEDHKNKNTFETVFKFEKDTINDIILIQPECKYLLAVCDRRNILVLTIDKCKFIKTISFPKRFDKFAYLSNPNYPYIIFISDRVGKFYIYDISNYKSCFISTKIFIGPHRITSASFSNSGMLLSLWLGGTNQKLVYWAVKTNDTYSDFKIILTLPSSDNSIDVCPYLTCTGQFYILIMEKKRQKLNGNRLIIYEFPKKRLIGTCILDNNFRKLYFTYQTVDYIFGSLVSNPNKFIKFSLYIDKYKNVIEQSTNNVTFLLPHVGEYELIYSIDYTYSYGLEDGLLQVLDTRQEKVKRIFSGYIHRGAIVNNEDNRYAFGGIKKCLSSKCGNFIVTLAQNGILTGHKFRKCKHEDTSNTVFHRLEVIKKMQLVSTESCISVSMAIKKYPLNKALLNLEAIKNQKDKEQAITKGSKWAHCYATQFQLTLIPNDLSPSNEDSTTSEDEADKSSVKKEEIPELQINVLRSKLVNEFKKINCDLLGMFRKYFRRGRLTLPFPLFIVNREDLKEFFRRLDDIEDHTEANIRRRMIRTMKETISLVNVFRQPFNNAQLIRGILNPEIKAWNVGTRILSKNVNWRKLCEKQWHMRKVLHCGYKSTKTFPINPKMQKKIKLKKTNFPDISCLNAPEVLYVTRKTVGGFKESDMWAINKTIQEAAFLKNLRASVEFYSSGSKIDGTCNSYQSLIDYKSLLEKLCTKDTYVSVNSFNKAISDAVDQDKTIVNSHALRHQQADSLTDLFKINQARFYEIRDDLICRKCKKVPIYSKCTHKPKCYPCFHDLKCTLSRYVFPELTKIIRAPDVSADFFCKPMRYMNYYRFILHPHVKCCTFKPEKGFVVSSSRTDDGQDKQLQVVKKEKPNLLKNALTITSKKRELPPRNYRVFSKKIPPNQKDIIWDESLENLIRICSESSDCELLLRKLFFKCSQRLFCDSDQQYVLLKSLKHLMKYTSFFPLHTYLALPWLRELVKEVTDLRYEQTDDYKKILNLYPEILTYKKTDYHDPFKIPVWWDKFLAMIADARKSINHKLAKVYVMTTYEEFFPKDEDSDVSSDDSVDSEMAKSPADIICGYKKIPCHQVTEVGLNEEVHRYGDIKVRKIYPASERLTTRIYNDKFKQQFVGPLEDNFLAKWRNVNQFKNNPRLAMSLTRYDNSKYMNPEKEEISSCEALENLPDCIAKRQKGSIELPPYYLDKAQLIYTPNLIYRIKDDPNANETVLIPSDNNYRVVPVTNISDPFVPVQPHHPNTKYWRPFTLKWLLNLKKPLSPRLLNIVRRLVSYEIPSEIYDWFKNYVGLISKIQRVIKNRLLNYDLKKINKLQYHEYSKIQKLVYPIKLLETTQWLALIIHKLSIINKDIIDSTEKIMSIYCGETLYKKHPLRLSKGRYPIKGKPFDPRKSFKLVVSARFPNSAENTLIEELNKTNQLGFYPKMYEPQEDLKRFLSGPVNNTDYVLKLLINRQILQMCAVNSKLHEAPKDWFTWRPLQQGSPNWIMIITVALASKLFSCTLSNTTRRLYKILRDSRKFVCRKGVEQNLKKRINVENIIEKNYQQKEQAIDEEIEQMVWAQPNVAVSYKEPDLTLTKYTGDISRNEENLMAWRKHEKEFLGKIKRKDMTEKLRMEVEIEDMYRGDDKGWEMYLEQKRYWTAGFRADPLHSGFPPIFDKKNKAIIDFGDNYRGCLGVNAYEVCQQRQIKAAPKTKKNIKQKKIGQRKNKTQKDIKLKWKKKLLFMKKLILDGPTVRYTTVATYYSNRFEHFTPINSRYFGNVIMLTVEKLSRERDRLLGGLRTIKHHIINFMLLMHIKREHIKKKLAYFCECDDYYAVYYKRQMKLIPDEKLNYLHEVDDEDNIFYRNGKLKEKTDYSCGGIIQTKFEDDEPYLEKELTRIMGGTITQNYLTSLKAPFLKPPCYHIISGLSEQDKIRIERNLKKGIILEKERDLTVMEFKRQMGWFSIYKEWFKWSFDYILAYQCVFQMLGIENSIKAEETKFNSLQKVKWEIRKIITSMDNIRKTYLVNITEYLYIRTTILSDIEYFRKIQTEMKNIYEEIEKLNTTKEDLKIRILRENPYLKESTLDHLLNPTISVELLKGISVDDLKTGYKFYYLRQKPVYHFYQINTEIGKYYQQVRCLNDIRLYSIMSYKLRRELVEIRIRKQILYYRVHIGHKRIEEFYARLSQSYKYATTMLQDLKKLHLTCYRKLNLLKKILNQTVIPVSVSRKQLDKPLWELVKPYAECKPVKFVAVYRHISHPRFDQSKQLHRFKEMLITDRIDEAFAIRKTLITEIALRKLYIKLLKMPAVRFLDGKNEDLVQHYKEFITKRRDVYISTTIKGYDKVQPKLHLNSLAMKYLKFLTNKKCLEFEKEKLKNKRPYSRIEKEPPLACTKGKHLRGVHQSKRSTMHFGALAWFVKSSWEYSDYKLFYKPKVNIKSLPSESKLKSSDNCALLEHSNKVYDFLRTLIVPEVPPPSPASNNGLLPAAKMIQCAQDESNDIAYTQDEIIFNYLINQIKKLSIKLNENGKKLEDIPPKEMEKIFKKWIYKLFSNWHIRVPHSVATGGADQACTVLLKEFIKIQTKNLHGFLTSLIEKHSAQLDTRNIDRKKPENAYTEDEIMFRNCVEHLTKLHPPLNVQEVIDEGSGTEKKCTLTVYAKFENNLHYTLSEEQYILILDLINEHMKKYNKDNYIENDNCSHVNINKEDLFKDWIAFAFEKVFLNPVQYIFIKTGERLIKMYDSIDKVVKIRRKQTNELKTREMIISFIKEYRELERFYPNIHIADQLEEDERINVREPLLYKWTALKRYLEKLKEQNKHLEVILAKLLKRTYPVFGEQIVPLNERLTDVLLQDCNSSTQNTRDPSSE